MAKFGERPSRSEMLLQHLIVFASCVVFPGAVTFSLPATWIQLSRSDGTVNCQTWTCAFFVVPFKIQRVTDVKQVDSREISGRTEQVRKAGRTTGQTVEVDGQGWLQFQGANSDKIEVRVSPASLASVMGQASDFLANQQRRSLTLFAIANWKFGGLMGGVLTALTVLYVFSLLASAMKQVTRYWARKG